MKTLSIIQASNTKYEESIRGKIGVVAAINYNPRLINCVMDCTSDYQDRATVSLVIGEHPLFLFGFKTIEMCMEFFTDWEKGEIRNVFIKDSSEIPYQVKAWDRKLNQVEA